MKKKMATHRARTARPSAQTKAKDQANSFSLQPAENPIPNEGSMGLTIDWVMTVQILIFFGITWLVNVNGL